MTLSNNAGLLLLTLPLMALHSRAAANAECVITDHAIIGDGARRAGGRAPVARSALPAGSLLAGCCRRLLLLLQLGGLDGHLLLLAARDMSRSSCLVYY